MALLSSHAVALPYDTQEFEPIRQAIEQSVRNQNETYPEPPKVHIGRLDRRLRLARCTEGMEVFMPAGAKTVGNTTVGVRCNGPERWTVYLPLTVKVFGEVLVAENTLPQGTLLEARHFRIVRRDLTTLFSGYISDLNQAVGMRLKRSLPSGAVLTATMLAAPPMVRRGELVDVVAELPGLQVHARGRVLKDGAADQRVPVRNLSSDKVIEGTVVESGVIKVQM
jgi:flagella basal body P-ring formation protein FlgA